MGEKINVQSIYGKEFQNNGEMMSGYRAMIRINKEGLWRDRDEKGKYIYADDKHFTDEKRTKMILQEEIPKPGESNTYHGELPERNELKKLSKELTNGFISMAAKRGMIPIDLVILVGKVTRGSDVDIYENISGGLNFDHGKEKKPEVLISSSVIRNRMGIVLKAAERCDIKLSTEQALAAAIVSVAAHEYGHSVDRTIGYEFERKAESLSEGLGEKSKNNLGISNFGSDISAREAEKITMPIFENLDNKNGDVDSIHRERLATAFEFEGLKFGLIKRGIKEDQAEVLVETIRKSRYDDLVELSNVIDNLKMDQLSLLSFCLDLRKKTKKIGLESSYIPSLWGGVGYCAPYTDNEVEKILYQSNEKIKDIKYIEENVKKIILKQEEWGY